MIAFGEIGPWQIITMFVVLAVLVSPLFCIWFFFIRKKK